MNLQMKKSAVTQIKPFMFTHHTKEFILQVVSNLIVNTIFKRTCTCKIGELIRNLG